MAASPRGRSKGCSSASRQFTASHESASPAVRSCSSCLPSEWDSKWGALSGSVTLAGTPGACALFPGGDRITVQPRFATIFCVPWETPAPFLVPHLLFQPMRSPVLPPSASRVPLPLLLTHQRRPEQVPQVFPGSPILVRPDGLPEPAGPWTWVVTIF